MVVPSPSPPRRAGLRLLGHPVHAALSAFPLALLAVSVLADGVALSKGDPVWWSTSFWAVAIGLCAAVPTACAGLFDFAAIEAGHPAVKTSLTHMVLMLTAVGFFAMDLLVRGGAAAPRGLALAAILALDGLGAALLMFGGWYGGELVFRHGIGQTNAAVPAANSGEERKAG